MILHMMHHSRTICTYSGSQTDPFFSFWAERENFAWSCGRSISMGCFIFFSFCIRINA